MQKVYTTALKIAKSEVPVLITGETGVGKELIANLIHINSRPHEPFVKLNCAALPKELVESEIFGHIKGAFTGAMETKEGLFKTAGKGTILLDELGEMPVRVQAKLLRVLQEKKARAVGANFDYDINCRVLASTNRNPQLAINEGKLRQDLYYRLNTIELDIPALRERREDILALADHFLENFKKTELKPDLTFTQEARDVLLYSPWPGNVRQLENEIHKAVLLTETNEITPSYFSIGLLSLTQSQPQELTIPQLTEKNLIEGMLLAKKGNKMQTAQALKIGRQTLYTRLKNYNIDYEKLLPAQSERSIQDVVKAVINTPQCPH